MRGKEAREIETIESDHDRGRNGQRFGTRGLCSTQGGGDPTCAERKIDPAYGNLIRADSPKGQVVLRPGLFLSPIQPVERFNVSTILSMCLASKTRHSCRSLGQRPRTCGLLNPSPLKARFSFWAKHQAKSHPSYHFLETLNRAFSAALMGD